MKLRRSNSHIPRNRDRFNAARSPSRQYAANDARWWRIHRLEVDVDQDAVTNPFRSANFASPIPDTDCSWSTEANRPWAARHSVMR